MIVVNVCVLKFFFHIGPKGGKLLLFSTKQLFLLKLKYFPSLLKQLILFQLREVEGVLEPEAECMKREIISTQQFSPESID